jgi:general secretion pathway protein M
MSVRILSWWHERTPREQRLLLAMLAVAALLGGWLLVVRPLSDALDSAKQRHGEAVIALAEARGRAELRRRASAQAGPPVPLPVEALVARSASDAGFTGARVAGQGPERATVAIEAARAPALFAWVRGLEQSGLVVDSLRARANGDRTLSADIALRARASR